MNEEEIKNWTKHYMGIWNDGYQQLPKDMKDEAAKVSAINGMMVGADRHGLLHIDNVPRTKAPETAPPAKEAEKPRGDTPNPPRPAPAPSAAPPVTKSEQSVPAPASAEKIKEEAPKKDAPVQRLSEEQETAITKYRVADKKADAFVMDWTAKHGHDLLCQISTVEAGELLADLKAAFPPQAQTFNVTPEDTAHSKLPAYDRDAMRWNFCNIHPEEEINFQNRDGKGHHQKCPLCCDYLNPNGKREPYDPATGIPLKRKPPAAPAKTVKEGKK